MRYAVLLQRYDDGSYQASVPILPGLVRTATSREEALQLVRNALIEVLNTAELLYVNIPEHPETAETNPWLETAGMFRDDPTLEPILAAIYAERDAEA
jgi:predicted RNase H-like HicB family nuclease